MEKKAKKVIKVKMWGMYAGRNLIGMCHTKPLMDKLHTTRKITITRN